MLDRYGPQLDFNYNFYPSFVDITSSGLRDETDVLDFPLGARFMQWAIIFEGENRKRKKKWNEWKEEGRQNGRDERQIKVQKK
jgi:hypothetical protein